MTDERSRATRNAALWPGRLDHLASGADHRRRPALALIDDSTVTVIDLATGKIIATNDIDPDRGSWRNTRRPPADGRGLSDACRDSSETYDATQPIGGSGGVLVHDIVHI
ncbi:hypothetical protein [Agrococcus baldri]|uniref:Uncharacterized protein n=1 Tax=Agrococcus baldri TaxID=153730 RepID=A0AA87RJF6_9MICO|nr:hypothetical protein [Agrococcus baldri]GEK81519.1 hypothetical protein ABA31_28700 [Agrococcus baldri]